jgi:hypothetical protein
MALTCLLISVLSMVAEDCTQDAPPCFITLGGVYREDCLPNFVGPTANYLRAVNAMNNGSGFGVNAGGAVPKYFYRLRWMNETYPKGKLDVGLAKARVLFPQLDFVQGMGARCAGSDPDLIQMANLAKQLKRIYITGRGPSMLFQPPGYGAINVTSVNEYLFSLHLNADLYPRLSLQQLALMYPSPLPLLIRPAVRQ